MKVSRKQARDLIAEISAVVDIDINIMDDTGTIVASTDDERIDQFHEGAQMLIRDRRSELIVHYDNEFRGCRKGINLPLIYKDKIIGVIGLTGEIEETIHYARDPEDDGAADEGSGADQERGPQGSGEDAVHKQLDQRGDRIPV